MNNPPNFQRHRPLKDLCTFGIGGPADHYIEVHTIEQLQNALQECHQMQIRTLILGKGSNCLFDEKGFGGAIIHNRIDFFEEIQQGVFHVGAGYSFSRFGTQTARKGWSGLEFASGIPGTVGGAVFMNAGANGNETCESLTSVDYVTESGERKVYHKEELTFSYRYSLFHEMKGAIVGATFVLSPLESARQKQIEIITYRKATQPYGECSAGCMFRNPEGYSAGELIERCGLKGLQIGGAKVSTLHGNFIINTSNGTSQEVLQLVQIIQQKVKEKTGIDLEREVRYIPY